MKTSLFTKRVTIGAMTCVISCAMLAGCDRGHTNARDGVQQTKFPGQVTAGGLTSGQVMARSSKPETNAAYAGGTPGIAGGSGGTTGGAALGGTVAESGHGPNQGATTPASAGQAGNKPVGDYGGPPANAPAAGVTPVGAGSASNQETTAPRTNMGNVTGAVNAAGSAGTAGAPGQPAKPPAAPGTLTGDK
ncbi:MAG: hypothetical protein JWP72_2249 [Massilia sp.]|nr:hypothetical protein [Massilia sp.]MDB5792601.1 hypothetical protein [Massilia sp.]